MRTIVTLALKDLRLLLRDRMGLFFIAGFPVIMGLAFGAIGASFSKGPSSSNAMKVGVVDEDDSDMSRRFVHNLGNQGGVEVQPVERAEAADLVRKGKLAGFIAIPQGFGETAGIFWAEAPAIQVGVDPSRQAESGLLQGLIMQAMGELIQHRFTDTAAMRRQFAKTAAGIETDSEIPPARLMLLQGFLAAADVFLGSLEQVMKSTDADAGRGRLNMEIARIETVDVLRRKSERGELLSKVRSSWDISFPAAMMWGVMACVAGFAVSIVKERTGGTFLRLKVAPISRTQILAGKAAACFATVLAVIALMMLLGLILGIQLARPGLLILAAVCIALGFVGLMMTMSVIGKSEEAVNGAAWAIIVVMCMFGGGMMPLAFLPKFMTIISHFSPVKWAILALEGAIWRGFTGAEMLLPCGVLLGVGITGFLVGATVLSRQDA